MKNITLACMLIINFVSYCQSNFNIGFKDGFKNGYCYTNNQSGYYCTPPMPPMPPMPQISENSNSYNDGYNRGFLYGQARRRGDENNSSSNVNPNPPKFNPYIPQSPILELTPQEREYYYAAKARQQQASAEALGALLGYIFTETPEGRARRAKLKAKRQENQYRRNELSRIKKEERKQSRVFVYGSENYFKAMNSKKIWLGSAFGFGAVGAASFLLSKNYYNEYQSATTDAQDIYNKVQLQNKIYPIAFGLAGFCGLKVYLISRRLNESHESHTSINIFPINNGGGVCLTYKF
jgi:hypothetical protein